MKRMTNEEAQNLIARNRSVFQYDPEMLEALDLATEALEARKKIITPMTTCKFGDLKKGDRFCYEGDKMIKTCRIKAGNDGAFYTAVSIVTGNHYCIADDLEVYV